MQSRMDKYQQNNKKGYERSRKNTKLYEEVYDDIYRDTTYKNTKILDSAKEINLNKLKNMLEDKYDTRQYRTLKDYDSSVETDEKINLNENKLYDINQIINEAKRKRTFIEEAKEKKKYYNFTERMNKYNKEYESLDKEEKELEELINTMAINNEANTSSDELDILSDLKGNDNTVVTNPVESDLTKENSFDTEISKDIEKTLIKADKTFYTDSNMFTKNDFEDFSTLSKSLGKRTKGKVFLIIFIILLILGAVTYYVLTNYVLK